MEKQVVSGAYVFGYVFRCTSCPFEFSSGWSHHAGGQFLVCRCCGRQYLLAGGESCWGASRGERLQLFQFSSDTESFVPAGIVVVVNDPAPELDGDGVSRLQFADIPCQGCSNGAPLVQSLEDHSPCPACHDGFVMNEGRCIY